MGASQGCRLLWIVGAALVIFPHLNLGLLSDFKICGDSECASLMSRVQAIKDHHGKDCRFLSFKRGETIFVYHKLTGKREDLWAGSIDKHFGYFPKDAVQEEQVYATTEKVVETQKSDFFCLDEFGYPIDSTHLDSDDVSDVEISIQESETDRMTPSAHILDTDGPVISTDDSTESLIKAEKAEGDENKNAAETNGPQEEAHGTPATLNEQGGSPSSSWLGSSPLGWLGLAKEEQPEHLAEGEREDERIETESETSLTSSVTGWLGFGEKGKPETVQESLQMKETADSFASTMTGWLGFGSEKETDPPSNEREEEEADEEKEPTEKFRGRRMSLDLEGSQLHKEEESSEMGTLGWLGNGLSSRLGFGLTNQDPENEPNGGEHETEKEELVSSSWMDMGIGSILGFGGDDVKADESKEKDATLEQAAGLENADASRSQVPPTDEINIETSGEPEVKEPLEDQNVPVTEAVSPDNNDINDDTGTVDREEGRVLDVGSGVKVDRENIPDHAEFEEKSQAGSGTSSMINSLLQMDDEENENVDDEDEDHQMPNSKGEDDTREPEEEEINTSSDGQDFITQPEISSDLHHSFDELKSNFTEQSVVKDETDRHDQTSRSVDGEEAKITNWVGNLAESSDMTVNTDNHKGEKSNEEANLPPSETSQTQTEELAEERGDPEETNAQSQLYLSSVKESNEPTESSFTLPIAEPKDDNSSTPIINRNAETESELGKIIETQSMEGSSPGFISSIDSQAENTSEEYKGTISSNENTLNISNADVSSHMEYNEQDDAGNQKETAKDQREETETETSGFEEEISSESDLESTQTETGRVDDLMLEDENGTTEEKENEEVEDVKDEEKHEEVTEEVKGEEQQGEMEEKKGKEKQVENGELEEEQNVEDSKGDKIEESKGKEEEGVIELQEEEIEARQQEVEELKEDENQAEEILEQGKQVFEGATEKEMKEEGKQMQVENIQSDISESALESIASFTEKATQTESQQKGEEVVKEEEQQIKQTEDGSLKCLNEHCSQDGEEVMMMEGDGGSSEDDEGTTRTEEQKDPTDQTGERQATDSDDKTSNVAIKENDNAGEQMRETDGELIGRESHSDGELPFPPHDPHDIGLGWSSTETATQTEEKGEETKEEEAVIEEEVADKQQMENAEDGSLTCSNGHCGQEGAGGGAGGGGTDDETNLAGEGKTWTGEKIDPADQTGERQISDSDDSPSSDDSEVGMRKTDGETAGRESHNDGGELSAPPYDPVLSQATISEQTAPHMSEDLTESIPLPGTSEAESGGAFSVFKNAFGFFSQTHTTESKESTQSAQSHDTDSDETSQLTPETELDLTTDSHQAEEVYAASTTEQPQPHPPSVENLPHTEPTFTPAHQTNTISKHYKNLLSLMSVDETAVLLELFGRHKLQFLDYILTSSEAVIENRDDDQSIITDIEALLHHHRDTLTAPSMRLTDAPQEDKEKTRMLIALQKLEELLKTVKETFNTGKSDVSNNQAEPSCVGPSCLTQDKDEEDAAVTKDNNRDEHVSGEQGQMGGTVKERNSVDEENQEAATSFPHTQTGSLQPQEGGLRQILDFTHQMANGFMIHAHAVKGVLVWLTVQVVSSLPDDIRPGPDLYGVPWEPVIIASLLGLLTVMLFTCRCFSSIKSRMYRSKERWMAEQVAQLLDEKCKVLETLSQCQQEYDDLESSLKDSGVLAQTQKTENLELKGRQLEQAKRELGRDLEQLKDQLDQQREHRQEQERRIALLEESMKTFEEETKDLQSQEEQAQTTLKIYSMNSDRLQRNLETAGEENAVLLESNAHLKQQVEGWAERVSELEAEMQRCEVAHSGMLQDVSNKDERIMSLTDRLLRIKAWDSDMEEEENEEGGEKEETNGAPEKREGNGKGVSTDAHLQKVQKLIYAAKLNADLKSVDEDKDRVFAKLNDEVSAKEDLQVGIKEMEKEKLSLQADREHYSDQVQRLQQKLQIMTEMYQENELKLHRMLTVEEKERVQKEEKLHKADKNIAMAMEELNNYRQRAEEMEEELEKTRQSYQTQISAHEKKAHNNWLAARAAERELSDIRRENGLLRQKLTDTQFKLDSLDKDPYALNSLARPLPFRAERSPYGPSPLGRPSSETRAFLSPPTLMDGPPARLSPRVSRGSGEPPGGQGEMERSGGPHSDSGSISPTWERDRRGPPPGPPGYMFPEPGAPIFRRPPPGPLGPLPPPGSLPPGPLHPRGLPPGLPHPMDMADGSFRDNSLGPGDQEPRVSALGDQRTSPESDPRMGGPPPPGPPMGPIDGPFPRRAPYGPPPPPDFYPPRGPGGPPMMPMWAPPPPGMMFPPRFPPGGPPLPPAPHPSYGPPMGPPPYDGFPPSNMGPPPPQQSLPSQPHSQSPEQNTPSPEDAI